MMNSSVYYKMRIPVDTIFEIRLCPDTWEKIQRVARLKKRSYSWVVRYAVFRLIQRKRPDSYILNVRDPLIGVAPLENIPGFFKLHQRVMHQRSDNSPKHRHKLCLYGEDGMFIRLVAISLKCSITYLVRFALEKYLDPLINLLGKRLTRVVRLFHESCWYWLGIKIQSDVELPTRSKSEQHFNFTRFKIFEYF